jgi:hydrogenase maturation protein HypF
MFESGKHIRLTGIVQGVGFRPFVYNLATQLDLSGWVANHSAGVDIRVAGCSATLDQFIYTLKESYPPLARIDTIEIVDCPPEELTKFEIRPSRPEVGAFQPIAPDFSICDSCLHELLTPGNFRYHYPFINCTNCGPRFTIIQDIPYDRPKTTMAQFEMCPTCREEYEDPANRRFHAQPIACPQCGPKIWLENDLSGIKGDGKQINEGDEILLRAQSMLANGYILAIKGLGGFHLACDATNAQAVAELRRRKRRQAKPFAVMMPDLETIEQHCFLQEGDRELLTSPARPIVLLSRKPASSIVDEVAPHQQTIGVMLPYTPLQYLLFLDYMSSGDQFGSLAFVMTSGNASEEPILHENNEARQHLSQFADAFLMHNREIFMRCDDSVMANIGLENPVTSHDSPSIETHTYFLRRSRGYAPDPLQLPWAGPTILATGSELKNTFCFTRDRYAFVSHHIGTLDNFESLQAFEQGIAHYEQLFRMVPKGIAYDLHPNYLATRYALSRIENEHLPGVGVQHHHAHIAACMVENLHPGDRPVIGIALDGTGYGDDQAIWGSEFLLVDYGGYRRVAHLEYVPMPGGDIAVRQPWRMALAWLEQAGLAWDDDLPAVQFATENLARLKPVPDNSSPLSILRNQISIRHNSPLTSSMGRLFDAVSALLGVCPVATYEGQAAIELESLSASQENGYYPFLFYDSKIALGSMFAAILVDLRQGLPVSVISARFHNTVVSMIVAVCKEMRQTFGIQEVALSGGVWQNRTLFQKTVPSLQANGFKVLTHAKVPSNDGCIALGQAVIAINKLKGK